MVTADSVLRSRRQRGWYFYDWANSPFYSSVTTVFGALYLSSVAEQAARADPARNGPLPCTDGGRASRLVHCDISLFGLHFPAGSLWGYLLSVAAVSQIVLLPVIGAFADRARDRVRILGWFALLGAVASAAMFLVSGSAWVLGAALYLVANLGYGGSLVVYYALLPDVADVEERDAVSARGWAFGYLGGGLALAAQLALYLGRDAIGLSQGEAVRWAFLTSGLWWAVFTVIPLRRLRGLPRPEPAVAAPSAGGGFRELRDTLRSARAFPLTLAFLGCFLLYSDGISTVVTVSGQYGKEELGFADEVLIVTILVIQFVAYVGGVLHGLAARRFGARRTIQVSLLVWVLVLGGAYLVQPGQQLEFYAVAVGIGLVLGGTNALSRSLYSRLIPPGKQAQYYSLYEVGERGTSWLGPLVFAGVGQATGSFRAAILAIAAFFVLGLVLLSRIPLRRGIAAAGNAEPSLL